MSINRKWQEERECVVTDVVCSIILLHACLTAPRPSSPRGNASVRVVETPALPQGPIDLFFFQMCMKSTLRGEIRKITITLHDNQCQQRCQGGVRL